MKKNEAIIDVILANHDVSANGDFMKKATEAIALNPHPSNKLEEVLYYWRDGRISDFACGSCSTPEGA